MKILLLCLFISTSLYAQESILEMRNFNTNYEDPSGEGFVDSLKLKDLYDFKKRTNFTLEKQASKITLKVVDEYLEFEEIPDFIHELKNLIVQKLDIEILNHKIYMALEKMNGQSNNMSLHIEGFVLDCFKENSSLDIYLNNCINGVSSLELDYVNYTKEKETIVKEISFIVKNNKFNVSLKAKGQNIKGYGMIEYDQEKKIVSIKVEKLKAGFINVQGMLFKELEKLDSENIEITNPWIKVFID